MNTPRFLLFLLLTAAITHAQAQDNPAPAPATEPAPTGMQKWIATTDAQWQATFKRDVTDMHEAELNKAKLQYLTSLQTGLAKASGANDLKGAVALRDEQKRFGDTNVFPDQDDAADAASVKQIRAAIRVQLARVEKESVAHAKALHAKYDAVLAQAQAQLTQHQRLDDALLVQAKRDEIKTAWLAGIPASPAPVPTVPASTIPPPTVPPAGVEQPASAYTTLEQVLKTVPPKLISDLHGGSKKEAATEGTDILRAKVEQQAATFKFKVDRIEKERRKNEEFERYSIKAEDALVRSGSTVFKAYLWIHFSPAETPKVLALKKGSTVTASGRIAVAKVGAETPPHLNVDMINASIK